MAPFIHMQSVTSQVSPAAAWGFFGCKKLKILQFMFLPTVTHIHINLAENYF